MDIVHIRGGLSSGHGRLEQQDKGAIGTSTANKYYPVINTISPMLLSESPVVYYYYRLYVNNAYRTKGYDYLLDNLKRGTSFKRYDFKRAGEDLDDSIYIHRGYIADDSNRILLCLCSTEIRLKNTFDEATQDIDPKKFKLFVATQFMNASFLSNVWKFVDKNYVTPCIEAGIRVEYMGYDEIEEELYKNEFKFNFKSVSELVQHLKIDVKDLLFQFEEPVGITEDVVEEIADDLGELLDEELNDEEDREIFLGSDTSTTLTYTGNSDGITINAGSTNEAIQWTLSTNDSTPAFTDTSGTIVLDDSNTVGNFSNSLYTIGHDPINESDIVRGMDEGIEGLDYTVDEDTGEIHDIDYGEEHYERDQQIDAWNEQQDVELDDIDSEEETHLRAAQVSNAVDITIESDVSILELSDLRLFLYNIAAEGGEMPISMVYTAEGQIIALYDGRTDEYCEEDILDNISDDAPGVPLDDNPIGVNDIFESMTLTTLSGRTYSYENRCEGFIEVDTLNSFVDAIHVLNDIQVVSLLYDVDIDVQDVEGNQHLFNETDVYNIVARFNSTVANISTEVNLIDDTNG